MVTIDRKFYQIKRLASWYGWVQEVGAPILNEKLVNKKMYKVASTSYEWIVELENFQSMRSRLFQPGYHFEPNIFSWSNFFTDARWAPGNFLLWSCQSLAIKRKTKPRTSVSRTCDEVTKKKKTHQEVVNFLTIL